MSKNKIFNCEFCDKKITAIELVILLPEEFVEDVCLKMVVSYCGNCDCFGIESFDFIDSEFIWESDKKN